MARKHSVAVKIGKYLKYQREKRGLSMTEFARLTTLDPSFVLRVEKGYYQSVSFDATEKIAAGLNMSLDDFLVKCQITPARFALPTLEYYFKEQYQFPDAAIKDIKLMINFLQEKYKVEIAEMKLKHQQYWSKQKRHYHPDQENPVDQQQSSPTSYITEAELEHSDSDPNDQLK